MSYRDRSTTSGNSSARHGKSPRSNAPAPAAMSSPIRPAGGSGAAGNTGSLKERKFSLLYRDVLECAPHVLRSKEEFAV